MPKPSSKIAAVIEAMIGFFHFFGIGKKVPPRLFVFEEWTDSAMQEKCHGSLNELDDLLHENRTWPTAPGWLFALTTSGGQTKQGDEIQVFSDERVSEAEVIAYLASIGVRSRSK